VPAICGAALFARRDALDAVGWFPDYYTVYYEDVDLCLRLRSRGGTLVFCPSSIVDHYHTGTNREHSPRFVENVARSSLLFVSRYGAPGVIARALRDRIRYSRDELLHGGGWRHAAGMRGFLSAVPALRRTLASRIGDRLRGRPGPAELVGTRRVPYQPSR
jgi:GT2 family glycosyltransferase